MSISGNKQWLSFGLLTITLLLLFVILFIQNSTFPRAYHNLVWRLEQTASINTLTDSSSRAINKTTTKDENDKTIVESFDEPFWPNRVFAQYKEWHGTTTLQKETIETFHQRKFSVVYYWCPDRAGNVFHNMFNTIVWSMIANRTIIVAFDNTGNTDNTKEECDQILKLSSWIPQWEEWHVKLGLHNMENQPNSAEITIIPLSIIDGNDSYDREHKIVVFPQIIDLRSNDTTIYRNEWRNDPADLHQYKSYIGNMEPWHRETAGKLYSEGVNYLLGMLFRKCFIPHHSIVNKFSNTASISQETSFSLALHSRHTVVGDRGEFINEEIDCLLSILPENRTLQNCFVFLISDRHITVTSLSEWLTSMNCTPVTMEYAQNMLSAKPHTSQHPNIKISSFVHTEHGERAGVGFVEDLLFASQARNGYIGDKHRSSFMLLVELISYDRKIEAWKQQGKGAVTVKYNNFSQQLVSCALPVRAPRGYNFGPGTPTFRHYSKQEQLKPVAIIESYKMNHNNSVLNPNLDKDKRKFAIAKQPYFTQKGIGIIRVFLNSILLAVLTNRTILVRTESDTVVCDNDSVNDDSCSHSSIVQLQEWIPSYETWSDRYNLTQTGNLTIEGSSPFDNENRLIVLPSFDEPIVDFLDTVKRSTKGDSLVTEVATKLYDQGSDFLYGMLLHQTIMQYFPVTVEDVTEPDQIEYTIALNYEINSYLNTSEVKRCLKPMIMKARNASMSCHVYSLLNHASTRSLFAWIQSKNCSVEHIISDDFKNSVEDSSSSLLQIDWIASKARSAFIGPNSRASNIVLENIEYKRRMAIWRLGRDPPLIPTLDKCTLR